MRNGSSDLIGDPSGLLDRLHAADMAFDWSVGWIPPAQGLAAALPAPDPGSGPEPVPAAPAPEPGGPADGPVGLDIIPPAVGLVEDAAPGGDAMAARSSGPVPEGAAEEKPTPSPSAMGAGGAADGPVQAGGGEVSGPVDGPGALGGVVPPVPLNLHLRGGAGDDTLLGGAGEDTLQGGGGADLLIGGGGRDDITGGDGPDTILGGEGNDLIQAGDGANWVEGGPGQDLIGTGAGNDTVLGGAGMDLIATGAGADWVEGGEGDDMILLGAGDDMADGGAGDDLIFGGEGADRLLGGAGNDILSGGPGLDQVLGGEGDDLVIHAFTDRQTAPDILIGGSGRDTLRLDFEAGAWGDAANRAAVAALARWVAAAPGEEAVYVDDRLGIAASGFEGVAVQVDGLVVPPSDWMI